MKIKYLTISLLIFLGSLFAQETDTLYFLQTTDVHGQIYPYNYFKDEPADYGLAKVYTRVVEYRRNHKNVVLLDGGDLIQGTPMIYFFNMIERQWPNPMILTMNYMGYDAFAVGNHDIEQGYFVYNKAEQESNFPWLSANSLMEDGRTLYKPYTIIERNGIKIGIIGLTTPGIPMWLDPSLYPGITWTDMMKSAQSYALILRPQVDVLVGLFHAGFNEGYSADQSDQLNLPNANPSRLIADQIEGFDIVFAGHSHQDYPKDEKIKIKDKNKALMVNAGSRGRNLGVAEVVLRKKGKGKRQNNKWNVIEKNGWLEPMKDVPASQSILDLNKYYHEQTLKYIRTEVAKIDGVLSARNSRIEDNPVVELINRAQMALTGADISFAASFNDRVEISNGKLTIKDIYSLYPYENFLYVVEMTGQQIKDFLAYSARYFMLQNGKITTNPAINGYNYDMAEGIRYTIVIDEKGKKKKENERDERQTAIGNSRIENLVLVETGQPLVMDKVYKVAMNSYRATGGGGHMGAAGASNAPIIWKSNSEMRNILAEYVKKLGTITPQADGNWQVKVDELKSEK